MSKVKMIPDEVLEEWRKTREILTVVGYKIAKDF